MSSGGGETYHSVTIHLMIERLHSPSNHCARRSPLHGLSARPSAPADRVCLTGAANRRRSGGEMSRQRAKDTEVMRGRVMMARRRRQWRRWVAAPHVARVPLSLSRPLPLSAQPGHSLTQGKVAKVSSTPPGLLLNHRHLKLVCHVRVLRDRRRNFLSPYVCVCVGEHCLFHEGRKRSFL